MIKKRMIMIFGIILLNMKLMAIPQIYPSILEINLNNKKMIKKEIIIQNMEKVSKKYEVKVENNGDFGLDLAKHMIIFPKIFSIRPGTQKTLRVAFKDIPYDKLKDGEYRAILTIVEKNSELTKKYKIEDSNGEKPQIGTQINLQFEIGMTVYVRKGKLSSKIKMLDIKKTDKEITGEIKNIGNYSFIPIAKIYNDKKTLEEIKLPKILRGEEMKFNIKTKNNMTEDIEIMDNNNNVLYKKKL